MCVSVPTSPSSPATANASVTLCAPSLRYPALRDDLRKERSDYNPYHIRMFEAVALAMLAQSSDGDRSGYPGPER